MTRNAKNAAVQFPVVLKVLHDDIVRANPSTDLTTKKMRVTLRAKMSDVHARNSSWTFTTQSDYDRARSLFDAAYAAKIAKPARAPRARKAKATTPAASTPATTEAE